MKARVLITGASGFVGYHLVEEALKNNMDVFAAVRKTSKTDQLKKFDVNYVYGDLNDVKSLVKEMGKNKYDYIIHAAGATKARSVKEFEVINAGYTNNIARAVLESKIDLKKLVFISSLAAIGPLKTLEGEITELTPPQPVTAYGRSKLLAEKYLENYPSINYTILRPTAVYGPYDTGIYIFFKQLAKGIEPYIGSKEQKLSFIYVTDLAKVTLQALRSVNKGIYNLSDGNFYDRYRLAELSKEFLKSKTLKLHLPVNFVKIIAAIAEKYGSLRNKPSVLNTEKLEELMAVNWSCAIDEAKSGIEFNPEYDLKAGVTETLTWYKANKWL